MGTPLTGMANEHGEESREVCIVLDTNVWRRYPLLRTSLSTALLFSVQSMGAHVALPEITEMEVIKHAIELGQAAVRDIVAARSTLGALTGLDYQYRTPNLSLKNRPEYDCGTLRVFYYGCLLR